MSDHPFWERWMHATPGPYKYDSGNGDIESVHPDHSRSTLCKRAYISDRVAHYETRFVYDLKEIPYPGDDMKLIEAALNEFWERHKDEFRKG